VWSIPISRLGRALAVHHLGRKLAGFSEVYEVGRHGVLRGEALPTATAPRVAPTLTLQASLMRVVLYGTMVLAALFAKDVVTVQRALELARSVCRDPASAAAAAALDRIGAALRAAAELLRSRETAEVALDLVVLSVALAATEPA